MQNFCVAVRKVSRDLLTEWVGWMAVLTTTVTLLVLGIVASSLGIVGAPFGWIEVVGYLIFGLMAFGGAVGFASFVIQTGGRSSLLFPVKSVEYLGVISLFMLSAAFLVVVARFHDFVFG